MRKVIKSFTFWFVLIAIFEIFMHQIGQDSKNIILIHLNPILRMIYKNDSLLMFMDSGMEITCRIISETISIYWYIAFMFSMAQNKRCFWQNHAYILST